MPELPSASARAPDGPKGPARDDDVISISSDDGDKPARKKQKVTAMAAAQPPMAGDPVYNTVDSLSAFWPGLQVLAGDIENAIKSHLICEPILRVVPLFDANFF